VITELLTANVLELDVGNEDSRTAELKAIWNAF
jgi:hypothetical protein